MFAKVYGTPTNSCNNGALARVGEGRGKWASGAGGRTHPWPALCTCPLGRPSHMHMGAQPTLASACACGRLPSPPPAWN